MNDRRKISLGLLGAALHFRSRSFVFGSNPASIAASNGTGARIDAMINLSDPSAVMATRLPWDRIEAALLAKFEREDRAGQTREGQDLFGATPWLPGT